VRPNRPCFALFAFLLLCLAAGSLHAQVIVTLSTSSNNLLGNQTANLQALVTGAPTNNNGVTWGCSVQPNLAGACSGLTSASSPASSSGISTNTFRAPVLISAHATVTITATAFDGSQAAVLIALTPTVITVTVSPSTSTPGPGQTVNLTAIVQGTSQTSVNWTSNATVGSFTSSGNTATYVAPNPISANASIKVTATLTADSSVTGSATITLAALSVTMSPTTATLTGGQSQQFSATVNNGQGGGVTWAISPAVGSIDQTGNYSAPATVSASQKVTVTATSVDDPSKSASATVTLNPPTTVNVTVSISPTTVTLSNGQSQQFTATVTNAINTGVLWSITPSTGAGTLDSNGNYTAPATITVTKATITVQSLQDPSKSANATVTLATTIGVGSGAPTDFLLQQFLGAYARGGFQFLVSLPPLGLVKVLGAFSPTAYVQEFSDAAKTSGVKYALATGSPTTTGVSQDGSTLVTVYQILSDVYAYYTTVGASTAGLPLSDTQSCPFIAGGNTCTYQAFDKNYILFVYKTPLASGITNVFIRNASTTATFNTVWNKTGGLSGVGLPLTAESATLTAAIVPPATAGTTYIVQTFSAGAIYALTSGVNRNTIRAVLEPFYDLYQAAGGPSGKYGLPIGDIEVFTSGLTQQRFEGGILQIQGNGGPTGQLPVTSVLLSGASSPVTLALGNSVTLTATPRDTNGSSLVDRPVSWSSSNGKVLQVQANGQSATVTAVGGGTANVTASSGGVTSAAVAFVVTSPCCQVGDGAPATVQSAFQNAIARNKLSVQIPVASPAQRVGGGYIQMVQSAGASPVTYMLAQADQVGSAYVLSGALLSAYQAFGGPAGALGYPASDASPGGTQLFSGAQALAGNPVHLVSDPILTKWALLKYETGAVGAPVGDAAAFSTFGANSGVAQTFAGGAIYSATAGPRAGQSYFVTGLVLSTYSAGGSASGALGMPVSDEFVTGGIHQQNFEGGNITYSLGAATAQTQLAPKIPAVIVAPAVISAGTRARLAVAGFPNGSTIQVSVTGQPAFNITTATGAYSWEMYLPLSSTSQTLSIHAVDTKGNSVADGTLVVRGFADNRVLLTKLQGDNQTAAPGALLPVPLQVALLDSSGVAVSGATVVFQPYPGVQLSSTSAVTDAAGHASVSVRLPAAVGTAGVTVSAPSVAQSPVTFYALATASSLPNFPKMQQSGSATVGSGTATIAQKGALLTAVASILRYHQNRGEVASPNGLADPSTLNQFLAQVCTADGSGNQLCDGYLSNGAEQIVNLWRAADFTGGLDAVSVTPTTAAATDFVAQGEPVLLSLSMSLNGSTAGGHFVVATGIDTDGSILIQDPSPLFAKTSLTDYLSGFSTAAGAWKASLVGLVRFAVRNPGATRFLMGAVSQPAAIMNNLTLSASSAAGACGLPVQMLDSVDGDGNPPPSGPLVSQFVVCDGTQSTYQIDVGTNQAFHAFVTDLAKSGASFDVSGAAPASYQAGRPLLNLALAPLAAKFESSAVVNAATFSPGISPGGLFSIFGSGLSGPGIATTVDFDGVNATILAATPFQINAQVPATLAPGSHVLHIKSAYGAAQQTVAVADVSPGIFLIGTPPAGAIENSTDGTINSSTNPLPRGQALIVFATGLGAVTRQGQFSPTTSTVTAILNGVEMPVFFAGLSPGFTALYQVNVIIPPSTPPGLGVSLTLKEAGQLSNTVFVSLK
jgi:uncharacterized protein (TIGR03437 family)